MAAEELIKSNSVALRIVGLYFNAPVPLAGIKPKFPGHITVKEVMDEYIKSFPITVPRGLAYDIKQDYSNPASPKPISVLSLTHHFEGRYDFEPDGVLTGSADGKSLNNITRQAGLYKLQEFGIPGCVDGVVAWQYYVEDPAGFRKSKTPASRGFKFFDEKPDYKIEKGDTITWRMVAILLSPTVLGKKPDAYNKRA